MMFNRENRLAILATTIAIAALALGFFAFSQLDDAGRDAIYESVAQLSWQAVVIVVLGVLVKTAVEDARQRREQAQARLARRQQYIRRLVDISHAVDLARTRIWADRSTSAWSTQLNGVADAYVDLRDVKHDLQTAGDAHDPVFDDWQGIEDLIKKMIDYLNGLIEEYGKNKTSLLKLQREADKGMTDQSEVWDAMLRLPELKDFEYPDKNGAYSDFRDAYRRALAAMRSELA